jgi:hypothetical protein
MGSGYGTGAAKEAKECEKVASVARNCHRNQFWRRNDKIMADKIMGPVGKLEREILDQSGLAARNGVKTCQRAGII